MNTHSNPLMKDQNLLQSPTAEQNRKELLRSLTSNIEQLCLALSMDSPYLVELRETKGRNAEPSADMTWFQKISGPTLPTTTQAGETAAAPSPTGSAAVSSRYYSQAFGGRMRS